MYLTDHLQFIKCKILEQNSLTSQNIKVFVKKILQFKDRMKCMYASRL